MLMKLYGRSHPDPKTLQWWSTLRVMNPMGVKDGRGSKVPYEIHGFKRSNKSKVLTSLKGSRASGFSLTTPQGAKGFLARFMALKV